MVATGATATVAFILLFTAYSIASPSVVSPFEYSILLWAPLIGWLYFEEIPTLNTVIGILTVSYTHLRAHETDSYLVCRLLLEKNQY